MARKGVTLEEVEEEVKKLNTNGVRVSVIAVRDALGRGSYTTIASHLKILKENEVIDSTGKEALPEEVRKSFEASVMSLWAKAQAVANALVLQAKHDAQVRVDAAEYDLELAIEKCEFLEEKLEKYEQDLDRCTKRLEKCTSDKTALKGAKEELAMRYADVMSRLSDSS